MSAQLLTILLWLPLIAVLTAFGFFLCAGGWRRGTARALVSLGATAVAFPAALALTWLLRPLAAPPLAGLLCRALEASPSLPQVLTFTLSAIFVESLVAVCLFALVFGLLALVLKGLAPRLLRRHSGGNSPIGAAIGALDGLILTFFLLLPLYGTVAAYGPSLHTVIGSALTQPLENHPAAAPWHTAPARTLYYGLTRVDTDSGTLHLTDVLPALEALPEQAALREENNFRSLDEEYDLLRFLRREVVGREWFRPLYAQFRENTRLALGEASQVDYLSRELMLLILEAPPEQMQSDCMALLGYGCDILESGTTKTVLELAITVLDMSGLDLTLGNRLFPDSELTLTQRAQGFLYGDLTRYTVKSLVILLGDDPLDIGDGFSPSQKQWLSRVVTTLGEGAVKDPEEQAKAADYLRRFLGV